MPRAAVCHRLGHPLSVEEVTLDPPGEGASLVTVFAQHLLIREGRLPAPSGPGWGVEVNPHWLAAAGHRESRF